MKKDIRIGTLAGKGVHTAEYIKELIPLGFESFQINFWQQLGEVDLEKLAEELKGVMDGHDVVISSISMFGNPLGDEEIDQTTRAGWEKCIDMAHLFETDLVTGFTGRVRGQSIPDSIPRFKEIFGDLTKRAEDKGVKIAFENCSMDGTWQSGDWNIAHCPKAWELIFDAVDSEYIGLEWEPCHQMVLLIDPIPQIKKWGHKIFHVHGKDATILHDVVREHGIHGAERFAYHRTPGFGESDWTRIISDLRMIGYQGCIDIEGWHDPVYHGELEMTGQVHALKYLKNCRAEFVPNPSVG